MSIWPDTSKADRDELREQIRQLASTVNTMNDGLAALSAQLQAHSAKISDLGKAGAPQEMSVLRGKLEALELWKGQIHGLLTETSPQTGRPKLTSRGKSLKDFFGR